METILVVEDTDSLREVLCSVLESEGYTVTGASTAEEALSVIKTTPFSLVLSDLKLPGLSGLDFIRESKKENLSIPVVVMTAYGNIDTAVEAMKLGAMDFITKPFDPGKLCDLLAQIFEHRRIVDRSFEAPRKRERRLVTQNPEVAKLLTEARKVAPLSSPVMLLGESGTGKELIARFIHENGPRNTFPFVGINCGSMPGELLESEFFGHEAGSFTGATEKRVGLFEVASKGSLFLDEIGNMPEKLQTKLLRTLQESEIRPLGSNVVRKIQTRVISATNCDIEQAISERSFREDLYYRLGVIILDIPPLRERRDDIELLAHYFVKCFNAEFEKERPNSLPRESIELFESYDWPGNVRELENVIERAMVFHDGPLLPECFDIGSIAANQPIVEERPLPEIALEAQRKAEIEAISRVLTETRGNKSKAAKLLGVSYKTLLNKVKDYEL